MNVTLLVLAVVLVLARAAAGAEDIVPDVLNKVKTEEAQEHIRHEIEQIVKHFENIEDYLKRDEALRERVRRQASVSFNSDGSTTVEINIPLGFASVSGSLKFREYRVAGASVGGAFGVGVQGTGRLSYDRNNGFGGSLGIGFGSNGYGTGAQAGWSQRGGLSSSMYARAGAIGSSFNHGAGNFMPSFRASRRRG